EDQEAIVLETRGFGRGRTCKPADFAASGKTETLGIRPERPRVLWDDQTARNQIAGTVLERHDFGEITHLMVTVPGLDRPLAVTETNDFGADDIPVGAPIRLGYDPDALVAMAD